MNKQKENTLLISEDFFSVQCEGLSSGYPANFVRLANCNLSCGASMKFVNQFKKDIVDYDPGSFQGDLHSKGEATWTCDTIPVWAKGTEREFQYLIDRWTEDGILNDILDGLVHIIWTGGEPTIPSHQEAIVAFSKWWSERVYGPELLKLMNDCANEINYVKKPLGAFYEIETNGTIYIEDDLFSILDQINCSPKLENSGMTVKQRIVPKAIERIMSHKNYQFKFVISTEDDIKQMFETYINPFKISLKKVVCMPGLDSQENFHERTRFVLEMAKKYKFIGLTRLHVSAWDRTTGV